MFAYISRITQYLQERFDGAAILISLVPTLSVYWKLSGISDGYFYAFSAVYITMLYLLLRLFDEFRDYEFDKVHHPTRPLVRGLISKTDLRILMGILAFSIVAGSYVINAWFFYLLLIFVGWQFLLTHLNTLPYISERFFLANTISYISNAIITVGFSGVVATISDKDPHSLYRFGITILIASVVLELSRKADRTTTEDGYRYYMSNTVYTGVLAGIYLISYGLLWSIAMEAWLIIPLLLSLSTLTSLTKYTKLFMLLQYTAYLLFIISYYIAL